MAVGFGEMGEVVVVLSGEERLKLASRIIRGGWMRICVVVSARSETWELSEG